MRVVVVLSSAALALAAGAQATLPRGTLAGIVKRGPVAPVCVAEQPCDAPASHLTLVFTRNSAVVARTVTDAAGRYRLRLPVGTYSVRRAAAAGPVDQKLDPKHVRVYAGRVTQVDFSIDTGIR